MRQTGLLFSISRSAVHAKTGPLMSRIEYEESMKFYTFLVSSTRKVYQYLKCQEVYQYENVKEVNQYLKCQEVYQYLKCQEVYQSFTSVLSYKYISI